MKQDLELIRMSDIQPEEVQWLWYPYIPLGKLTVIQGDPGEGKTTFVLAMIAALTKGEALPEREPLDPVNILYQTAEDGLADTIRPRLDALGADCSRVLVIDENNGCRPRPCRRKKPCGTCWTNLHRRKKSCGELLR